MARIKVKAFLEEVWLPGTKSRIRDSTHSSYRSQVRNQLVPRIGHLYLDKIGPAELNALYAGLLGSGRVDGKPLAPASVRRVHATLHRAFADAVRWGYLTENPADRCDPPRVQNDGGMATWSGEKLAAFLEFCSEHEFHALFLVLATTGLRRGEALGLRWEDVNLDRTELAIRRTILSVAGKVVAGTPKTARGRRVVAIDPHTVAALAGLRAKDGAGGLVFNRGGEPLDPIKVSTTFARLVRASGLPRIRLHDLRHTHATLALQAGVHPKIVSERLGHATVALTLDVYSHAIPHLQVGAATKVAALIFGEETPDDSYA